MIFVGITEGQLQFSNNTPDGKVAFAREDRPKLVLFLRRLIEDGWDGHVMTSSSMNWPEEDGWQGDVTPRDFLASCIREAAVPEKWKWDSASACGIIEACGDDGDENAMSYAAAARYLAQRQREFDKIEASLLEALDTARAERDEIAREFAELEHKYDQACGALVTLAEMTVPAEPPDDAGVLVSAAPLAPAQSDEKIADEVLAGNWETRSKISEGRPPTEFAIEERSETMVAEVEAALEAALDEQEREGQRLQTDGNIVVSAEGFAAIEAMIENPPEPTPALVALMQPEVYPDGSKIEPASTKPRKQKRGQ